MAGASLGTKFLIGTFSVADLTSIGGIDISADTIDVSTLEGDGWRQFITGMKDAGEVAVSGFFKPSDTNGQKKLFDDLGTGTVGSYAIVFPSPISQTWSFKGVVTAFSTGAELEDAVSFESAIKVSGKPSWITA